MIQVDQRAQGKAQQLSSDPWCVSSSHRIRPNDRSLKSGAPSHAVFEIWWLSGSQIAAVRSQRVDAALWLAATPLWSSDAEPDALKSQSAPGRRHTSLSLAGEGGVRETPRRN